MVHYPEKFRELHEYFLDAHARYNNLEFHLEVQKSYSFYRSHPEWYEILYYTGLSPVFSTKVAVVVSKREELAEPYSEFKKLATKAWTFLPDAIKRPIVETLSKTHDKPEFDYEYWVDFIFFLLAQKNWRNPPPESNESSYRPPNEVLIEPFKFSADIIVLCGLNTDKPNNPFELKLSKPEVLPAQSQEEELLVKEDALAIQELSRKTGIGTGGEEDLSAYVPTSQLWPMRPEFSRQSDCTKFLKTIPTLSFANLQKIGF